MVFPYFEVLIELLHHLVIIFLSTSLIFVVANTSTASSPIQYNKLLTCLSPDSIESPEAIQNCSNLVSHFFHPYSCLKLKAVGGHSVKEAITNQPTLTPCIVSIPLVTLLVFDKNHNNIVKHVCKFLRYH